MIQYNYCKISELLAWDACYCTVTVTGVERPVSTAFAVRIWVWVVVKNNIGTVAFRVQIGGLLLYAAIFFMNFLSRIIFAPLLVVIENDFQISHGAAGKLFVWISTGVCLALLGSGLVSSRLTHRRTILVAVFAMSSILVGISFTSSYIMFETGLFLLGLSAGLYFPSAIASLTSLVAPSDWGKAIAIHELAPNVAFVMAPLVVELLLGLFDWRRIIGLIGIGTFVAGVGYLRFGQGGDFLGESPRYSTIRNLLSNPSFWIMVLLLGLAIGASMGVYAMIPLYLETSRGMDHSFANRLVALSRVSGIPMALVSGWLVDCLGIRRSIAIFSLSTGITTMAIGWVADSWLIPIVFLQPLLAVCFFPAGFSAISRIVSGTQTNLAVGFVGPFAVLIGGGLVPSALGVLAEKGQFCLGFTVVGAAVALAVVLLFFLRFVGENERGNDSS